MAYGQVFIEHRMLCIHVVGSVVCSKGRVYYCVMFVPGSSRWCLKSRPLPQSRTRADVTDFLQLLNFPQLGTLFIQACW